MRVSSIMTVEPVTIAPSATPDEAVRLMDEHGVRHLPVLEGGKLLSVVSDRDLLEATGWLPSASAVYATSPSPDPRFRRSVS